MRNALLPVPSARGPFDAFEALERAFDDVMRAPASGGAFGYVPAPAAGPAVDVRADEAKIVVQFDLPGYRRQDVEVSLDQGVLTVKGARTLEAKGKNERVWVGRSYGSFQRSFVLPKGVDEKGLAAELADGVLTITVPRGAEAKPRRIEVRSAPAGAQGPEAPAQAAPEAPEAK